MPERMILVVAVTLVGLALMSTSALAGGGAHRGSFYHPEEEIRLVEYLCNPVGGHNWFTAVADLGPYEARHSYHVVYKFSVGDVEEWCGPITFPDSPPWDELGLGGKAVYHKIFDTTTDTQLACP